MISEKLKLDDIDRRIITLVQDHPDMTHTQIAKKISRSQPTVGMRIRKLEENGILQFQPGINFRRVDLYMATVEVKSRKPEEIMEMAQYCPFMLNAFRLSGEHNICILLASSQLEKLDNIVNYHFRNKEDVQRVSMEIVTEISKDFILPIDFDSEDHNPTLEEGCGPKCKWLKAKEEQEGMN
ncbi:MAG: winged helix-turn-helix transcriptional regulator [Candidatus Lokiarchaeota archaeon]|nr:winged helix-turn-helix transcriptional regulator [Candidatus Lokiarchaeota archaeon]MBD3201525.1 winged helix-turn-helix transcriptional regulator [Candidatus Lokiarchaeota archaeon]